MTQKFKVGVIGVGFIGPAHMESVRRLGSAVLNETSDDWLSRRS